MDFLITFWLLMAWLPVAFVTMCCCGTPCTNCNPTSIGNQFQIDLTGMTGDEVNCINCSSLDGTYILDQTIIPNQSPCGGSPTIGGACTFGKYESSTTARMSSCASGCGVAVYFQFSFIATYKTTVGVDPCGDGGGCSQCENHDNLCNSIFLKDHGASPPDCTAFSALDIPFSSSVGCADATSTCAITAL